MDFLIIIAVLALPFVSYGIGIFIMGVFCMIRYKAKRAITKAFTRRAVVQRYNRYPL